MFISFGALIGFFNCYATQMEQFLCSRGYSNEFSGLAVTLLITVGLVGSIIAGIMSDITGKLEEIAKICNSLACLTLVLGLLQILRKSELEVAIGILASM
jgi:FLVCR family MFS transporter 7